MTPKQAWLAAAQWGENSWRGDHYEPELRAAIAVYEDKRIAALASTLQAKESAA
jgi:hypothetical protein